MLAETYLDFVVTQFQANIETPTRFFEANFEANADKISRACFEMATRFQCGARLLVFAILI